MAKSHYAQLMADTEKPKGTTSTQAGDKYIIRFPEGMRDRIAAQAKANNRSMNAEIVDCLEASLQGRPIKAIEHYIRHIQLEMTGLHSELATFAQEARAAAQVLIGLCEDLEAMPGPKSRLLGTAKSVANVVIQSANRYGPDSATTLEQMREKADQIINGRLYPHDFGDRRVFEWAKDRARDLGFVDEAGNTTAAYEEWVAARERKPES